MPVLCNICNGKLHESSDSIVICRHKGSAVHLGCCVNNCSWDNKPCEHALSIYEKLS